MRKILLFLACLLFLFSSTLFVFAQRWTSSFHYSGDNEWWTIPYCTLGKECTFERGLESTKESLNHQVTDKELSEYVQDVVIYVLGFVTLIAVIYIIWAGFNIMIGNGDEEKLKDARKTILYVLLGIVVMWLSYSLVIFITQSITKTAKSTSHFAWLIPEARAQSAYTENQAGSFAEYKSRIQAAIEELESELRIHEGVQVSSLQNIKQLVQSAYDRLPDKDTTMVAKNESAKRLVDMYLSIAMNHPRSSQKVGEAISRTATFINSAQIGAIQGSISATPLEGNAPLATSFRAQNIKDPSGAIPPASNYIWWIRENGGVRRELGRWPTLLQEFRNEGTYTVFLDVISASRNSKGKTDVLPLSTSVQIEVKPKIGDIVLLVNGVNMSNSQKMKLSPVVGNQGIIFDASASRAIGNGTILETTWDFGNGNKRTYKWPPVIEREIFATQGEYSVKLSFKTNDGQVFSKDLQLVIVDPAATIKSPTATTFVGESVSFQAESYLTDIRNVEYTWQVQDEDGKRTIKSGNGLSFAHTFEKIGTFVITLTAKSPNGGIDADSTTISVEAREPIATLDAPTPLNSEHPNTFVFDASRSYDPDSNSRSGLSYEWRINGQRVFLENASENGARGTLTFHSTGENTVSVTVSNAHGKIATASQSFVVHSLLSGDMTLSPQVVAINKPVTFQVNSKHAEFYEWNMGDGSPVQNGSNTSVTHSYKHTGVYTVNVKLSRSDSNSNTTLTRKVYVTDADSPYALIDISNSSNSTIEEPNMCQGNPAFVLNRADSTTLSASHSTNIDGRNSDLDYTWRYMGKVSTNQSITETFRDLGCFPIELTVRSKTNGAKHTTTQWIQLKNQPPQLTNISTMVDANKKDSNKVIVKATANGVMDPDGVITSYMWYYTTESDPEPQSVQITQRPHMTFVLPNVTEKYYFGVILEDNDGERINSMDLIQAQAPLLIDNANGNINMPLISLNAPNRIVKAGEKIKFSAEAKIVTGSNVTNKSQYAWDFDGDGRIDERSNDPFIEHTYSQPGDYNMKVRVTHNGVSNTKYHTIVVRNELKAWYLGYKIPGDKLYLMNTSQGVFDTVKWTLGTFTSHQSDGVVIDFDDLPNVNDKGGLGTLTVSNADTDISTADILLRDITAVEVPSEGNIALQTYPLITDDNTITIKDSSEVLRLSFYGNTATAYAIDVDMDMDSDLDGTSDNDIDNKSSPSYENGSVFTIADFAHSQKRHRKVKITLYNGSTPIASKTLHLVLDFIPEVSADQVNASEALGELSDFDRAKLDELATMIRSLPDSERIIIMQKYNALVESWDNSFEKAKALIDVQVAIDGSAIERSQRQAMTEVIDALLIGDAHTTDQVMIATKLIRDLIPPSSANYDVLMKHIDAIESHPTNIAENKRIGMEILTLIQHDPSLEDAYKLHIRNQLLLITNQEVPAEETTTTQKSGSTGLLGILVSVAKIFLIILLIFVGLGLLAFIYYRMSRKDDDTGFQDFIIDRLFHGKKDDLESAVHMPIAPSTPIETAPAETEQSSQTDPLKSYVPPSESTSDPLFTSDSTQPQENTAAMPDWLNPQSHTPESMSSDPLNAAESSHAHTTDPLAQSTESASTDAALTENIGSMPDWLKPQSADPITEHGEGDASSESSGGLPDWLKPVDTVTSESNTLESSEAGATDPLEVPAADISAPTEATDANGVAEVSDGGLPDWLKSPEIPWTDVTDHVEDDSADTAQVFTDAVTASHHPSAENELTDTSPSSAAPTESVSPAAPEGDLPDWLKAPLPPQEPDTTEWLSNEADIFAAEMPETSQEEITWALSASDDSLAPQADAPQSDAHQETAQAHTLDTDTSSNTTEDALPAWLDALQHDAASAAQAADTAISQESSAQTEDLPSWLIDSAQDMSTADQSEQPDHIGTPEPLIETAASTTTDATEWASEATAAKTLSPESTAEAPEAPAIPETPETPKAADAPKAAKSPRAKKSASRAATSDSTAESSDSTTVPSENLAESQPKSQKSRPSTAETPENKTPDTDATDDIPEWLK